MVAGMRLMGETCNFGRMAAKMGECSGVGSDLPVQLVTLQRVSSAQLTTYSIANHGHTALG